MHANFAPAFDHVPVGKIGLFQKASARFKALVISDEEKIDGACGALGAPGYAALFPRILAISGNEVAEGTRSWLLVLL